MLFYFCMAKEEFNTLTNESLQEILRQVKENKKYKTFADSVVKKEIDKYIKQKKVKEITKQDIKKIRAKLHLKYASFQTKKKKKRILYINELRQLLEIRNPSFKDLNNIKEINNKLLSMTISTKERIKDYKKIYKQIFKITGKPSSIIDLGSGLNPLSYPYMNINKLDYSAFDIDEEDIKFLNQYFKIMKSHGLNGKAAILDLQDKLQISKLPSTDIIFLFKVIDIVNQSEKNYKASEELIKQITLKTKFIVASFPTKTITRKEMNYPARKWFELMLQRNNLDFKIIKTNNEIFYVIKNLFDISNV